MSQLSDASPKGTIRENKIGKVKSQLNHPPVSSFMEELSPMRNSKSNHRTLRKHSTSKFAVKESPILGITFKSKEFDRK